MKCIPDFFSKRLLFLIVVFQCTGVFFTSVAHTALGSYPADSFVVVKKILLSGNKKTKGSIILRETDIQPGDTLLAATIDSVLTANKNRIFNTRLFTAVNTYLLPDSGRQVQFLIEVKERWYFFPVPIFDLADRNFNEWWYQRGRNLARVNYGLKLSHKNVTGHKDELRLTLQSGFTRKAILGYSLPYINRKQTWGIAFGATYDQNKQIAYRTYEHFLQFLPSEKIVRERTSFLASAIYRKSFFGSHSFELQYNQNGIADTVARLNPNYFGEGRVKQKFWAFTYQFTYDKRDIRAYALKGNYSAVLLQRVGLFTSDDVFISAAYLTHARYIPLGRSFFMAARSKVKISLPLNQPYYNFRALGYDQDYVRGYDLYVIDGPVYGLQRITFRKKLWEKVFQMEPLLPISQFNEIPVAIYLNTFYDAGYLYIRDYAPYNSRLSNEFLSGAGMGLDIVTYYDNVLRIEYAVNKYGEQRFYLNFVSDI